MSSVSIKSNILRAVNLANPSLKFKLQLEDVTFGKPELYLQNLCNTRIKVTAKDSSIHFINQGYVFYNRRRLDQLLLGLRVPGKPDDYSDSQAVVKALAENYGLPLVPEEFTYAGVYHDTVELKPLDTCVGFFTNFSATLGFIGLKPFITDKTMVSLTKWTITGADGKPAERRSMAKDLFTPGAQPYLGALNQQYFMLNEQQVEVRAIECGADVVSGIAAWQWVSVQFFGRIDSTQLAGLVNFNGTWGRLKTAAVDSISGNTHCNYQLEASINPAVNTPLSIDF